MRAVLLVDPSSDWATALHNMFKAASLFRLPPDFVLDQVALEEELKKSPFTECGPTQASSSGWIPPRNETGPLIEVIAGQVILRMRTDTKKVAPDAVTKRVDEISKKHEEVTGRKPGKREKKEIKEQAIQELLPYAGIKTAITTVWIDRANRLLLIDSASSSRCDELITVLVRAIQGLRVAPIMTNTSPAACMTHWLANAEAPQDFSVDRDCEMRSQDEMRSVIRYSRHSLDTQEVRAQIQQGKVPTWLALTWKDRVSFVLTDGLTLKKIDFLDVVFTDSKPETADETFDADVAISTGELAQLIPALLEALGGESSGQPASDPLSDPVPANS